MTDQNEFKVRNLAELAVALRQVELNAPPKPQPVLGITNHTTGYTLTAVYEAPKGTATGLSAFADDARVQKGFQNVLVSVSEAYDPFTDIVDPKVYAALVKFRDICFEAARRTP